MPPGAPAIDIISGETNVAKGKKRQVVDDNFHGNENLKNSEMSKNSDENNFVCKQNDKDCWHRYSSAMGDCV